MIEKRSVVACFRQTTINSSRAEQKSIKMAFIGTIFAFVEFVTQSVRPEIETLPLAWHACVF